MFRFIIEFIKKKEFATKSAASFEIKYIRIAVIFIALFWYSASGYLYFELPGKPDLQWSDAIWWTLVTMTTVGYGDFFPESAGGRFLVAVPAMIFGISFLGFIISDVATRLLDAHSRRIKGMIEVKSRNHILIINFTNLQKILELVHELKIDPYTAEKDIFIIDEKLEELPVELFEKKVFFVKGDPTNFQTLERANLEHASHAIILSRDPSDPHSDDQNLSTTLVIEKLNPDVFSIVEVINPQKIEQIKLAGCDSVVCVSELTSNLIIKELQDPGVKKIIEELTSNSFGKQIYIAGIKKMKSWKYDELVLWGLGNCYSVIGIIRNGTPLLSCSSDEKITADDTAILLGDSRISEIII